MKQLIAGLILLAGFSAHSASYYFVDGKQVANQGEAKRASMKNPKAKVIKIQATVVQMNEETFNLRKTSDLTLTELKTVIK